MVFRSDLIARRFGAWPFFSRVAFSNTLDRPLSDLFQLEDS